MEADALRRFHPAGAVPGAEDMGEAQALAFRRPALQLGNGPHLASQAHLAHHRPFSGHGPVHVGGSHRHAEGQVGGGLVEPQAPGHVDIGVPVEHFQPRPFFHHGQQQHHPGGIHAVRRTAGHRHKGLGDQGLDIHQHRPAALQAAENAGAAGPLRPLGKQGFRSVQDRLHAFGGHFKNAQLVYRAKAVFHRPEQAVFMLMVPFKIQHHVHHMLQHPGPGQGAFLGHMAHQEDSAAVGFGIAHQKGRALPHLAHAARGAAHFGAVHGLDGVDHAKIRLHGVHFFFHLVHGVFGEHQHLAVLRAQALGPQLDLPGAFLAADIQHPLARFRQMVAHLQQQGGFADAGIAAHQNQRAFHNAAAQHPVQFLQAAGGVHLGPGLDLLQGLCRAACAAPLLILPGGRLHRRGQHLLHGVPRPAFRTLAHPPGILVPAGRALKAAFFLYHGSVPRSSFVSCPMIPCFPFPRHPKLCRTLSKARTTVRQHLAGTERRTTVLLPNVKSAFFALLRLHETEFSYIIKNIVTERSLSWEKRRIVYLRKRSASIP